MTGERADGTAAAPAIDVTLAGRTYGLRPAFGALMRIEKALGAGLGALVARYLRREYGLTDTTRIVYEGIVAEDGNRAPTYEEVAEAIVREGIDRVAPAALELLDAALAGFERFAAARAAEAAAAPGEVLSPDAVKEGGAADPTLPQGGAQEQRRGSPGAGSSAPRW